MPTAAVRPERSPTRALSEHRQLSDHDIDRLVVLSDFVTLARSPVERDGYTREIELVPDPEAPARFAGMLASILEGLRAIGLDDDLAWPLVVKVALDSMPAQRRQLIELLADADTTTSPAAATSLQSPSSNRTLQPSQSSLGRGIHLRSAVTLGRHP
jgi:hypothetical protein